MRGAVVLAALAWLALPGLALAALPEGLAGHWRGSFTDSEGKKAASAKIIAQGDAFEMDISAAGAPHLNAKMEATERPHVFQVAAARSLFGLFESEQSSDPFEGPPLLWARTTERALIAYRISVANDGTLTLFRVGLESIESGVEMSVQVRLDGKLAEDWRIMLEPVE